MRSCVNLAVYVIRPPTPIGDIGAKLEPAVQVFPRDPTKVDQ